MEEQQLTSSPNPNTIEWYALEYEQYERHPDWFWIMGTAALCIAVGSIYFHNILLAIIIILGTVLLFTYAIKEPKAMLVSLSGEGIRIHNKLYRFDSIKSFWIREETVVPMLVIESSRPFLPHIIVPIVDIAPEKIREFLTPQLKEVEHEISLIDIFAEYLGF